jgi:hypothetical protein
MLSDKICVAKAGFYAFGVLGLESVETTYRLPTCFEVSGIMKTEMEAILIVL